MTAPRKLAVLISFSGEGGVERMVLNLVAAFARVPGLAVDLLLLREDSQHLASLPASVHQVRLGVQHSQLAIPAIARYLRGARPDAMLVAKDRAGRAALLARRLAGVTAPIQIRLGTTLSEAMKGKSGLARWLRYQPMRWLYPLADGVVAVSQGVADDTCAITGLPPSKVRVIRNPVITPDIHVRAGEALEHPWFGPGLPPVVLGMGRLTRQKDFPTLLRAFARVRAERPARLVILGEGRDRDALAALARTLGIDADVAMPGFVANPYPWLARASLFVLSSAWEGSPNALTEALALGIPAVSTDCPSGPREILAAGRHGPLVAVGDVGAMATAMRRTLDAPPDAATLRAAVAEYNVDESARRYLEALGLGALA
jgi:glycosyltransferase involved in cell wall biosynthesis